MRDPVTGICPDCGAPRNKMHALSCPEYTRKDLVNHPDHYTSHPSGIECIEVTRHMSFNLGNAVKYIWRADEKGAPIEDLEKALWYIQDEIEKRRKMLAPLPNVPAPEDGTPV